MTATEIQTIQVGARVSYADMANPLREGTVVELVGAEYRVQWDEAGETVSDLRQHGWKLRGEIVTVELAAANGEPNAYIREMTAELVDGDRFVVVFSNRSRVEQVVETAEGRIYCDSTGWAALDTKIDELPDHKHFGTFIFDGPGGTLYQTPVGVTSAVSAKTGEAAWRKWAAV